MQIHTRILGSADDFHDRLHGLEHAGAVDVLRLPRSDPAGAWLEYLPDPAILMAGSRLTNRVSARLENGARLLLADAQLCHDPECEGRPFDTLDSAISLTGPEGPMILDRFDLSGADWAARTGGARDAGDDRGAARHLRRSVGTPRPRGLHSALSGRRRRGADPSDECGLGGRPPRPDRRNSTSEAQVSALRQISGRECSRAGHPAGAGSFPPAHPPS